MLAAKNDHATITLLTIPDINWYQNFTPHIGPFPDTHVIAHFSADTITYKEPTIPLDLYTPYIEPLAIHILCIHHQTFTIGTPNQLTALATTLKHLQIPHTNCSTHS